MSPVVRFLLERTAARKAGRLIPDYSVATTRVVVTMPAVPVKPPCVHEGAILEFHTCCGGKAAEDRHVRDCDIHEKCTRGPNQAGVASCVSCGDYKLVVG